MDEWNLLGQKLSAQRQQEEAERQRQLAAQQAAAAAEAKKREGIGGILAGIGDAFNNAGKTFVDWVGTPVAIIKDLAAGKNLTSEDSETQKYKKFVYGGKTAKDNYLRAAGSALSNAANVSDFIPGLGTGAKVALNIGQGAVGGFANEFANNGANADLGNALVNAAAGAAGAGAGQAVGLKLANAAKVNPAKGIVGKALQSGIGRGAVTGAVSGAVGGGTGAALSGGNALEGALQGAQGGALSGAATSALYDVAGAGINKLKSKIETPAVQPVNVMADEPISEGARRRQTPMGWNDEDLSGQAKKQNYLQKLGGDLQDAAQATRDQAIYSKLKENTADEMIDKDAINNLRKNYGYSPDDYDQAGKLSTAVNKWYDNEIQSSGATKTNTKLVGDLSLPDNNTLPDKYEKAYRSTINNALNMANAGDSGAIDTYSAAGLERAAKYLGEQEQNLRRTNMNGVGGRPDGDRAELADYYKNARQILRSEVNSMIELDDITKNNLSKMLDRAGATEQAKKKILSASTFSEVKSNTSPLEDARTMARQMKSSGLKRSAAGDNSVNITTQLANKTGLNNLIDVAGKPIRSAAAAGENVLGKAVSNIGNAAAGESQGIPGKAVGVAANVAKAAATAPQLNVGPINLDEVVNRQIARQGAINASTNYQANQKAAEASRALTDANTAYNTASADLAAANQALASATPATSAGAQKLEQIKNAMILALNAGDLTSYSKLADLYSAVESVYGTNTATTKLTTAQQSALDEANNSLSMVDQLEAAYNNAGGGQGFVSGNLNEFTNWLTGGNANAALNTYNSLKQSLGTSIVKNVVNLGGTEADAQRYLAMLPSSTDTPEQAAMKLQELRTMLNNMKANIGSKQ